ncbi:MAG: hypothetical protein HC879_08595 [Leptolyngbyaceae cyanobacterium SL_5_9]|nr:hypothetical protein [Leptolyngbyaceae cyanobacterium SL_5_9]NJO72932.1 hypothetical protein [Leptolyngbyaceae cyanobacterium RM1_406_9]
MYLSVNCPRCDRALGQISPDGLLQIQCPSCRQHYGAVYGKLSGWSSQPEAMLYLSDRLPSFYKRRYQFRITTPGRSLRLLKFSTPGLRDQIPVRPGDKISILYSTCGSGIKKLLAIHNHSTGQKYHLPSPVPGLGYLLATRGGASSAIALGSLAAGAGVLATTGLGAIALLLYSRLVDAAELTSPDLQPDVPGDARLMSELELADQKVILTRRIEQLRHEGYAHRDFIKRLTALKEKMLSVGAALYATRIAKIDRAIKLLKQRINQDRHLVNQYAQTIRMIEIELEASYLAEQLPEADDFTSTIMGKLDELKAIEDRNRNLWLELEANEEVRRLSFG